MQLIPDTINLSDYTKPPEFQAKVRSPMEFLADVKHDLMPARDDSQRHPTILSRKAHGLIEFRPGEVTCWSGYNGHRKSMYTSQIALDLAVQRQKVLIVSLEMHPFKTMSRMTRQALGTGMPSTYNIERFHHWTDGKIWLFDHVGAIDPTTMQGLCRYFSEEMGGHHLFIDSMMMVCDSEERLDEQKKFVTNICRLAQETNLHLHLITHCRKPNTGDESKPPSKYDIKGTGSISDQAHNVVMVWSNKAKKAALEANPYDMKAADEPDAVISVEKQRNGAWEGRLKFWFDESSMRFAEDRTQPIEEYVFE